MAAGNNVRVLACDSAIGPLNRGKPRANNEMQRWAIFRSSALNLTKLNDWNVYWLEPVYVIKVNTMWETVYVRTVLQVHLGPESRSLCLHTCQ